MARKTWKIAPLALAIAQRDKSQVVLLAPIGEPSPGAVIAWLLMSGNEKLVVDTGLPELTPSLQREFEQTTEMTIPAQLARFQTTPADIPIVINTHLHVDHCGGNWQFKNARFLVQKKELEYQQNPFPAHRPAYQGEVKADAFELLDGDAEIVPGVSVILTPGHSPGSQAVVVETEKGPYVIAGDTVTHFESMAVPQNEPFLAGPIYTDLGEYYKSMNRLKNLGAFILPGHDPAVLRQPVYP